MNKLRVILFSLVALGISSRIMATTYIYDKLNRVVKVMYDSGIVIEYEYDAAGNITKVTSKGGKPTQTKPDDHTGEPDDEGNKNDKGDKEENHRGDSTSSSKEDHETSINKENNGERVNKSDKDEDKNKEKDKDKKTDNQGGQDQTNQSEEKKSEKTVEIKLGLNRSEIEIDGKKVKMDAAIYASKKGHLMVPIRYIAYALDLPEDKIRWDGKKKQVIINGKKQVIVTLNQPDMLVDGKKVKLSEIAQVKNGRVYLPIGDICRAFDVKYKWDNQLKQLFIYR